MAPKGRPRETKEAKLLKGTFRPSREAGAKEPKGPAPSVETHLPSAPAFLCATAKAEWARLGPDLEKRGLISDGELAAFAAYCSAFAMWQKAEKVLARKGMTFKTASGYVQQRPEVGIVNQARKQCFEFAQHFGLTPRSRGSVPAGKTQPKDSDPWENL